MGGIETTLPIGVKFSPMGDEGIIEGYGSTFGGSPDRYGDIIEPGAFTASVAEHIANGTAPGMLWAHDASQVVGRWTSFKEDKIGLKLVGRLTLEVPKAREVYALAKDGAVALSIGYRVRAEQRLDERRRLLRSVDLVEVSFVGTPANPRAQLTSVKNAEGNLVEVDAAAIRDPRSFERFLKSVGFSSSFARTVTAAGFSAAAERRDASSAAFDLAREIRASANLIFPKDTLR